MQVLSTLIIMLSRQVYNRKRDFLIQDLIQKGCILLIKFKIYEISGIKYDLKNANILNKLTLENLIFVYGPKLLIIIPCTLISCPKKFAYHTNLQ